MSLSVNSKVKNVPMTDPMDEKALVSAARRDDDEAFAALVKLHWFRLVMLARSIIGFESAEDAVQESLIIGWQKMYLLRNDESFKPWITRIVVNQCIRIGKKYMPMVNLKPDPTTSGETGPEAAIDMQRILSLLAPRQRAVMHLTVIEGHTDSEIAQLLKLRKGTVRAIRRRARERLQKVFGEEIS